MHNVLTHYTNTHTQRRARKPADNGSKRTLTTGKLSHSMYVLRCTSLANFTWINFMLMLVALLLSSLFERRSNILLELWTFSNQIFFFVATTNKKCDSKYGGPCDNAQNAQITKDREEKEKRKWDTMDLHTHKHKTKQQLYGMGERESERERTEMHTHTRGQYCEMCVKSGIISFLFVSSLFQNMEWNSHNMYSNFVCFLLVLLFRFTARRHLDTHTISDTFPTLYFCQKC